LVDDTTAPSRRACPRLLPTRGCRRSLRPSRL